MEPTVNQLIKLSKNFPPLKKLKIKKIIKTLLPKTELFLNEFDFSISNIENEGFR
jgi:hypothetical protein